MYLILLATAIIFVAHYILITYLEKYKTIDNETRVEAPLMTRSERTIMIYFLLFMGIAALIDLGLSVMSFFIVFIAIAMPGHAIMQNIIAEHNINEYKE